MKIILLHHHLLTGGVTKVILSQLKALAKIKEISEIQILTGKLPSEQSDLFDSTSIVEIPELYYLDTSIMSDDEIRRRYDRMKDLLKGFLSKDIILHIHNVNLGKNPILNVVLRELVGEGYPVFNHCHDFAEDLRPGNYAGLVRVISLLSKKNLKDVLYPTTKNYQYGVLNRRDFNFLLRTGIPERNISLLMNSVDVEGDNNYADLSAEKRGELYRKLQIDNHRPLFLYPVRAIRRKNIGEFIFLAALFSNAANWAISRAPENPVEQKVYNGWVNFSEKLKLPVSFDAGARVEFTDLLKYSDRMVVTSVTEGFGLAFLEPWLSGKPVVGRDIAEITSDFKDIGVAYNGTYSELKIPICAIEKIDRVIEEYRRYIIELCNDYNIDDFETKFRELKTLKFGGTHVDFGDLDILAQQQLIRSVHSNKELRELLIEINLLQDLVNPISSKLIFLNRNVIEKKFSSVEYAQKLLQVYNRFARNTTSLIPAKENESVTMVDMFMTPGNMRLIRR